MKTRYIIISSEPEILMIKEHDWFNECLLTTTGCYAIPESRYMEICEWKMPEDSEYRLSEEQMNGEGSDMESLLDSIHMYTPDDESVHYVDDSGEEAESLITSSLLNSLDEMDKQLYTRNPGNKWFPGNLPKCNI